MVCSAVKSLYRPTPGVESRDLVSHGPASIPPFDTGEPGGIYQVWQLTKSPQPPLCKRGVAWKSLHAQRGFLSMHEDNR
jgi:hypothetical protein